MTSRRITANYLTTLPYTSNTENYKMKIPYVVENSKLSTTGNTNYPPYNVTKNTYETLKSNGLADRTTEYVLSVALAGFNKDEIDVTIDNGNLIIKNIEIIRDDIMSQEAEVDVKRLVSTESIHSGISSKNFYRVFYVGYDLKLLSCKFDNGTLVIVFEEKTDKIPRHIMID